MSPEPMDVDPDHDYVDLVRSLQLAVWAEDAAGNAEVSVLLPAEWGARAVTLDVKGRFGPAEIEWTVGPVLVEPEEEVRIALDVPESARVHDLQSSWMTPIRVTVHGLGSSSRLPQAGVLWTDSGPVVWTHERAAIEIPYGTLDPEAAELLASAGVTPSDWASPPVDAPATPGPEDTGTDDVNVPLGSEGDE